MNKKLAIILALAVVGVFAAVVVFNTGAAETEFIFRPFRGRNSNLTRVFQEWKKKHNKTYGGVEHAHRFNVFVSNLKRIEKINSVKRNFTVGLNKFSDLTKQEFSSIYLGLKKKNVTRIPRTQSESVLSVKGGSVDWRAKGAVTDVKDQGQCGSCWAFSTTGSLEGLNFLTNGKLVSFSEQQLVDCSGAYGNEGCNGGMMEWALNYTSTAGIATEDSYEYTAEDGDCQTFTPVYKNGGFEFANSLDALFAAVTNQPVSISVEADQDVFQSYTDGVLDSSDCGTTLDHGVLAVGYGTDENGVDYWIVKNSWGDSWGDNGYLKIARNSEDPAGICGINQDNSYPTATH